MPNVHIPDHPLIVDALAQCRDRNTATPQFRATVAALGRWLAYEICRDWLPTVATHIETPLDMMAPATILDRATRVEIVPILRAGPGARRGRFAFVTRRENLARRLSPRRRNRAGRLLSDRFARTHRAGHAHFDSRTDVGHWRHSRPCARCPHAARGRHPFDSRVIPYRVATGSRTDRREVSRCHDFLRRR